MKKPVPGQFCWYNGHLLRFKKRENGCKGCIYEDNLILCPGVVIKGKKTIDCVNNRVILVKT